MNRKAIITGAIILLLVFVGWMIIDLLLYKPVPEQNPYAYDLKSLGPPDSLSRFMELSPIKPALEEISGIAADLQGRIYVSGKGGVEIFDSAGKTLNRFTVPFDAWCIAVMTDGNLLLSAIDHIELWSPSGARISEWPALDTTSIITSLASDQQSVYAADAGKKIVYCYDHKGNLVNRIGEKDPVKKIPGFVIPSPFFDVAVNHKNELWVSNTGRYELEEFSKEGNLLKSWGCASMELDGFAGCCNPSHFTFLPDGSFVTAEKGIVRIKICRPDGRFQCLVAGPETFEEGTKGLDLAVDARGRILVLDPVRRQVRIFIPGPVK